MAQRILTNPSVVVNNNPVRVVPNSTTIIEGGGETSVKNQSAGGQDRESVHSRNVETQVGQIKFSLYSTKENLDLKRQWKQLTAGLAISVSEGTFSRSFNNMSLTNDAEISLGNEGVVELEFSGQAAV